MKRIYLFSSQSKLILATVTVGLVLVWSGSGSAHGSDSPRAPEDGVPPLAERSVYDLDATGDPAAALRLFGAPASFDERPEVSRARIYVTSPTTDLQDDATWPGLYRWIGERLSTLFTDGVPLLRKRIEALRTTG